jgi:AcrR family transcriptional regulator
VAARAGVGRPTLYRRFPTKPALVASAIAAQLVAVPRSGAPAGDDARAEVRAILGELVELLGAPPLGPALAAITSARAHQPELAALLQRVERPRRARLRRALERGANLGQFRRGNTELLIDTLLGPVHLRLLTGRRLTRALAGDVVDLVLGPTPTPRPR